MLDPARSYDLIGDVHGCAHTLEHLLDQLGYHKQGGTWRHPSSQASRYNDLEYWTNLAIELERGTFDSLFIADVVGVYDVYRGSAEAALHDAAQVPVNDPFGAISAMAGSSATAWASSPGSVPSAAARRASSAARQTMGSRFVIVPPG